jgi:tripartite-type tricarboxylate transporter receptor subunit TctC
MRITKRLLLAAALTLGMAGAAAAQAYPNRAVRIIVPFGPGGPADIYARAVGEHLSSVLKQPFVIENRAGAGASVGTIAVAQAQPDGYTLLMMSNTHTANETLRPTRGYDLMRDFAPVAPVNASDLVFVVHPSVTAKSLPELIAQAKAQPGTLNYASSGLGTPYHLAGENFKARADANIVHVPFRNSGDARTAVLGGHAQLMIDAVSLMLPTVSAGQLRALATTGKQRTSVMPDVPTAIEMGVPGFDASIWLGLMAPRGTPPEIIDMLNAEVRRFQAKPETTAAWTRLGIDAISMSPAEFSQFLRDDIAKWGQVIRDGNIRAE